MAKNFINNLFKTFSIFLALLLALVISGAVAILIINHDPVIKKHIENHVCAAASTAFKCNFNARVSHIDIFSGALVLHDVAVVPAQGQNWFWTSDSIKILFSWRKLFSHKQLTIQIICGTMQVDSQIINRSLAIQEHLAAFMQERAADIPVIPEHIHLKKATLTLHLNDQMSEQAKIFCSLAGAIDLIGNQQHIGLTVTQDMIAYHDHKLIKNLECTVKKITDITTKKSTLELRGIAQVRNNLADQFCAGKIHALVTDTCKEASFVSDDETTQAHFACNDTYTLALQMPRGKLNFTTALDGHVAIVIEPTGYDKLAYTLDYLVQPENIKIKICDEHEHILESTIDYNDARVSGGYNVTGSTQFLYELLQKLVPQHKVPRHVDTDFLNYKTAFHVHGMRTKEYWVCTVDCSNIQYRLPYTYNFLRSLQATGKYDPRNNVLLLQNSTVTTDRGKITSGLSTFILGEDRAIKSAHVPLIVQNFFINKSKDFFASLSGACTIDYRKDAISSVQGVCFLKKCHIRNNPFSGEVASDIVSATLNPFTHHRIAKTTNLDLTVRSYEPVDIKTPFLHARAHINVHAGGTVSEPHVHGHIELVSGTFNFPYKPLEITSGKVFFINNLFDDPEIEICASATIKDYRIMMYVDGTATQPTITFRSTPSLQEEQIIGLLFGGSPDSSLSLTMPLSSVSNIEKLIVGSSDESISAFDSLKSWLDPFEKVKIIPRFSDQTGRGGVKGALAIEVNDNLSALIQQNFNLSEDTYIEVAYKPFDELTIRGMRDERGDLGGELETRFTW